MMQRNDNEQRVDKFLKIFKTARFGKDGADSKTMAAVAEFLKSMSSEQLSAFLNNDDIVTATLIDKANIGTFEARRSHTHITPLQLVIPFNASALVELLLNAGADATQVNRTGLSPLGCALDSRPGLFNVGQMLETIKLIKSKGGNAISPVERITLTTGKIVEMPLLTYLLRFARSTQIDTKIYMPQLLNILASSGSELNVEMADGQTTLAKLLEQADKSASNAQDDDEKPRWQQDILCAVLSSEMYIDEESMRIARAVAGEDEEVAKALKSFEERQENLIQKVNVLRESDSRGAALAPDTRDMINDYVTKGADAKKKKAANQQTVAEQAPLREELKKDAEARAGAARAAMERNSVFGGKNSSAAAAASPANQHSSGLKPSDQSSSPKSPKK